MFLNDLKMRRIIKLGIFTISIGLILGFIHAAILILNYLYVTELRNSLPLTRTLCIFIILIGIFFVGISGIFSKNKEPEHQLKGHKKAFTFLLFLIIIPIFTFIGFYHVEIVPPIILFVADVLSVAFVLWILLVLPHITDRLGKQIIEIDVLGYHFHEGFFGICFIVPGFIFVIHGVAFSDILFGCYIMIVGSFVIGRDIEDVKQFKIIEKLKNSMQ